VIDDSLRHELESTVNTGLEGCSVTIQTQPALAPAAEVPQKPKQKRKARTPSKVPDPEDLTDGFVAGLFVNQHSDRIRYCPAWRAWQVYDGMCWRPDLTLEIERCVKETIEHLSRQSSRINDGSVRRKFAAATRRFDNASAIPAVLAMARSDTRVVIKPDAFDLDPFLLNCKNGTVDLRTGVLRVHDPSNNLTKLAPVKFVPEAACPKWDSFLKRIMATNGDMIGYLRRVAGYALTGSVKEQCLFLLCGHGRNGKSVFINTLLQVLGDYGMTAPSNLITGRAMQQHPTALADLNGARFVSISEPNEGRLDEALMKSLTGGDSIRARRMYQDFYEFNPTHKIIIAANHKPEVIGTDIATWRRIRLIPFRVMIPVEEQNKALTEELRDEAEGILAWMVRGCLEWQRQGLQEPQEVKQATMDYREQADPIAEFIAVRCERGQLFRCKQSDLVAEYGRYCRDAKLAANERVSDKEFARLLDQKGIELKKSSVMWRLGIRLKPAECLGDPPAGNLSPPPDRTGWGTGREEN
jgi:putative DNA primase/helicase